MLLCFVAYPFKQVLFANAEPLILAPEVDQHQSEISPLAASETFTQRRVRRIDAGSWHSMGSVNGASVCLGFNQT